MASLDLRSPNYAGIDRTHYRRANRRRLRHAGSRARLLVRGRGRRQARLSGHGCRAGRAAVRRKEAADIGAKAYWDMPRPGEVDKTASGPSSSSASTTKRRTCGARPVCLIRLAGTAVAVGT